MHKILFLHKVKPPTSKTFNFFQCKGITPFLLHLLSRTSSFKSSLSSLFVLPSLHLRSSFASNPLQIRSKLDASPFLRMGEKWDLQGICKGIAWELRKRHRNPFCVKIHKNEVSKGKNSINRR